MNEYFNLIKSSDVLDILYGKKTVQQLHDKLYRWLERFCRSQEELDRELLAVNSLFEVFSKFIENLTMEEYDALSQYGRKVGSTSFEINESLRLNLPLNDENSQTIKLLDRAISKFNLAEELIVYRALKTPNIDFTDEGYMSASLSLSASYATFDGYDDILEIHLPAGTSCIYLEWFKGAGDEAEILLARGTSLNLEGSKTINLFGKSKRLYICTAIQKNYEQALIR